jgi:hypothetical protein
LLSADPSETITLAVGRPFNRNLKSLEAKDGSRFFQLISRNRKRHTAFLPHAMGKRATPIRGCNRETVVNGIAELATLPDEASENRIRRPGGGRKQATVSEPDWVDNFF